MNKIMSVDLREHIETIDLNKEDGFTSRLVYRPSNYQPMFQNVPGPSMRYVKHFKVRRKGYKSKRFVVWGRIKIKFSSVSKILNEHWMINLEDRIIRSE